MHFHSPADSVSAILCGFHPDNWWARPTTEYPVFPKAALPEGPSSSARRSVLTHPCPVPAPVCPTPLPLLPPSRQSYKNHAVLTIPAWFPFPPTDGSFLFHLRSPWLQTSGSSPFPFQTKRKRRCAEHLLSSFPVLIRCADPDSRRAHAWPIPRFLHPAADGRLQCS